MRKHRMSCTNAVSTAKWNRVNLSHIGDNTTNSVINPSIFKRECDEYDMGFLPNEHELYIGERYV